MSSFLTGWCMPAVYDDDHGPIVKKDQGRAVLVRPGTRGTEIF